MMAFFIDLIRRLIGTPSNQPPVSAAVSSSEGQVQSHQTPEFISGKDEIINFISAHALDMEVNELVREIIRIAAKRSIEKHDIQDAVSISMVSVIQKALADSVITESEQTYISYLLNSFGLSVKNIPEKGHSLLVKGLLINGLLNGEITSRQTVAGNPFKFMKKETLIWFFRYMSLSERKDKTKMQGGSKGISVRIAKGVYWRTGAIQGERVTTSETNPLGLADVAITSHHIYYTVGEKTKRIKQSKVIGITPYSDAVVVELDGAKNQALIMETDQPWFLVNILQNAENWT